MRQRDVMKKLIVVLLILMLGIPTVRKEEAKAASKPSLSAKEMVIGIGSCGVFNNDPYGYYNKEESKYVLFVENSNKQATYTFKSDNKKIVRVKKSGEKCYITGFGR